MHYGRRGARGRHRTTSPYWSPSGGNGEPAGVTLKRVWPRRRHGREAEPEPTKRATPACDMRVKAAEADDARATIDMWPLPCWRGRLGRDVSNDAQKAAEAPQRNTRITLLLHL